MSEKNQEERWALVEGELENGLPYSVRFREDLPVAEEISKLKTLIIVSWVYESADESGLPAEEEENLMEEFENLMDEALVEKDIARLMTVFTGDGVREWQFYTRDDEVFLFELNEKLAGRPILPLEIDAYEDENWDGYKDYTGIEVKK
jgi:hypothetical protein